jgi:hypothetical protein
MNEQLRQRNMYEWSNMSICGRLLFQSSSTIKYLPWEEFEDTKGVIRIHKSKNRQHNGQNKKNKRTNNDLQSTTHYHKTKLMCWQSSKQTSSPSGLGNRNFMPFVLLAPKDLNYLDFQSFDLERIRQRLL